MTWRSARRAFHDATGLVVLCVWTAAWISLGLVVRFVTGGPRATLWMARRCWAPVLVRLSRVRVERRGVHGASLAGTLVAFNHQSLYDILLAIYALPAPLRFVGKSELRRVPFLGWHMAAMGMVFVERGARRETVDSLSGVVEILEEGGTVVCFPEGTRARDGRVGPFRAGVLGSVIEAGAPVVPGSILGTGEVLPPGGFRLRPGRVVLTLGKPIETAGLTVADRKNLADRVRREVLSLLKADDGEHSQRGDT